MRVVMNVCIVGEVHIPACVPRNATRTQRRVAWTWSVSRQENKREAKRKGIIAHMDPLSSQESHQNGEEEGDAHSTSPHEENHNLQPQRSDPIQIYRLNKDTSHSLEYLLEHRATPQQLMQQNIIHGNVGIAPAIQQTQRTLRFQQTVDTLDNKLNNRPNKDQLITNNIIRSKSADNLQAREIALNFQRTVDKLDHKFDLRPTFAQLHEKNILKMGIAPSLYATQQQLKFIVTAESLDHKLERRPPRSALVASNIVKGGDGVAPAISAAQQELKFHTIAVSLDHKIGLRPSAGELVEHNIMKEKGVHPSIQSTQQSLKFNKTKSQVGHKMHSRPSKGSLVEQQILFDESPFLRETKKKLIRRRVSSSLSSRLENRPTREEFDLRFRYYFTDSETGSSVDISSFLDTASYTDTASCADTASCVGDADSASNAGDLDAPLGMLRARSMPNCAFAPPPTIPEEEDTDGDGRGQGEGGGGREGDVVDQAAQRLEDAQYDDYYEYSEDYKSADDSIDCSLLSSSV